MKTLDTFENDASRYAACHKLSLIAPFVWLKKGWQDYRRAPWHSLAYGAIFFAVGWLLVYSSWTNESYFLLGLFISVLFVGPGLFFGLYDTSQQLELNHKPSFRHERRKAFHEMGHELMLSLILSLIFMVMLILTSTVIDMVVRPGQTLVTAAVPMSDVTFYYLAAIFAGVLYCANTFALPMIMDKDADAATAITTSLHAVWRNKSVMALWGLLLLTLTAIGFATALVGLVIIVPVLGYATWHAYRETIISS